MEFVKITMVIITSLIVSGCTTFDKFDNEEVLSKKTIGFITAIPAECTGQDKTLACQMKNNPARMCITVDEANNIYRYPSATCMAQKYPECYNSSTHKVIQKCIENLADARIKKQQELDEKKHRDEEVARLEAEKIATEARKARAEYERSPKGIAERKAREAYNKKLINSCNYFLRDILSKRNLKEASVLDAVETMPDVVVCTYQVTAPGVYVDIPRVITIMGNTQNGVYEYL
ncbi:hypothetical protein [Pseudomonas helleri]|uniref:Lipoprotein n=3 Tax=Pseudomonas helleri TaxID=1608996 RepID=A0A6A7Z4R0_9PSED|nr:hypothetical protein [Pseudomonas helleri]MQT82807.1 hypothetical protein [Pseudomonas helleri]